MAQTHSYFLWNAKLPHNHYRQTSNLSLSRTCVSATNTFEPGWILPDFIDRCPLESKAIRFTPDQNPFPFSMRRQDAKLPYNHSSDIKLFSNLNLRVGYKYNWAEKSLTRIFIDKMSRELRNNSIQPGSYPFPFSIGRPNFPVNHYSDNKLYLQLSNQRVGYKIHFEPGWNPTVVSSISGQGT